MDVFICLDIGGTNIRAALYPHNKLKPIKHIRIPTQGNGQSVEGRILALIEEIWPKKETVKAIGLAAPGYIDAKTGMVISAVNIPGWVMMPLRKIIKRRFQVPVFVGNDARLAALGEWQYGAARGHHDVVYLTISTGVGGGVIINDRLLMGSRGLATELGHITLQPDGEMCTCGQKGHLESYSSGKAIENYVIEQLRNGKNSTLSNMEVFSTKDIAKAAKEGDAVSKSAFERAGDYLGIALANYLHIFNPSCIVLGGGVIQTGDLILQPMRESLKKHMLGKVYEINLTITTAELGDDAGLLGALAFIKIKKKK